MARKIVNLIFVVTLALFSASCGTLFTSIANSSRLYKTETEKSVQKDISGNIETETETFWLVYDATKMPYITIVKMTQNTQNDISYGIFLGVRADLGAADVKAYGDRINEFISAISTIMIKTDDDAIITLTDSNPSVVKTGEWQGLALPSIIATHPISSELLAQLKKCNSLVYQFGPFGNEPSSPASIPAAGITAMQNFLQ